MGTAGKLGEGLPPKLNSITEWFAGAVIAFEGRLKGSDHHGRLHGLLTCDVFLRCDSSVGFGPIVFPAYTNCSPLFSCILGNLIAGV